MFPCVILCGGLATRLYPRTRWLPKSLLPIQGEPFIAHQLRLLKASQVNDVLLCIGFLGDQIQNFVQSGSQFGVSVQYSVDGPKPLGTAGAIRQALPFLPEHFFVLYGDSYLRCDYQAIASAFVASGKSGLMTVYQNRGAFDRSNVELAEGLIKHYDKHAAPGIMNYIDYGLNLFQREVFEAQPANQPASLESVHHHLVLQSQLAAYEVTERFFEIGSAQGILDLERHLSGLT